MSRLTPATWLWKPVAAVALAALLAGWADAAPPVPLGSTTATAAKPMISPSTADTVTAPTTNGPLADILALASFLADELELTFDDPWEEMLFFFAVADLYFQSLHHQHAAATARAAGGSALGSLTTVAK